MISCNLHKEIGNSYTARVSVRFTYICIQAYACVCVRVIAILPLPLLVSMHLYEHTNTLSDLRAIPEIHMYACLFAFNCVISIKTT